MKTIIKISGRQFIVNKLSSQSNNFAENRTNISGDQIRLLQYRTQFPNFQKVGTNFG